MMSMLLRAVFPRNDVILHVRCNDGSSLLLDQHTRTISGYSISADNNILSISSSPEFDLNYTAVIRIPVIADNIHSHRRTILGYVILGNDGHFHVWSRPMSFRHGVLPTIYQRDTEFCLLIQFNEPFESIFGLYRSDFVVNTQHLKFTRDGLFAEDNIIVGNRSTQHYWRFVCYDDDQYTSIRDQFRSLIISPERSLDPNAHFLYNDIDLHHAFLYYGLIMFDRHNTDIDPPFFDDIYSLIANLERLVGKYCFRFI